MEQLSELKIGIASDHAGYELKQFLIGFLKKEGALITDFGADAAHSVDYPDYAHPLAEAVESKVCDFGVAICGSGNGINMTVNKHQRIRAALCWETSLAELARQHNNANVLSLPARFVSKEKALDMLLVFLTTDFQGGRHQNRIDKISCGCIGK